MTKPKATRKRSTAGPRLRGKKVLGSETKGLVSVRSALDPEVRFFVASEQADDQAIEAEVSGRAIAKCVYEFKSGGSMVRGLSKVGVYEAVRWINRNAKSGMKIGLDHSRMFSDEVTRNGILGILAKCYAVDHISGDGNWGIVFEAYQKPMRGGGTYLDTFAEQKAVAKAQRNAKAGLIPEGLKQAIITRFVKQGSVEQIAAPTVVETVKTPIEAMAPSKPEDIDAIIMEAIQRGTDPQKLHDIANKTEKTTKLTAPRRQMLAAMARAKAAKIVAEDMKADEASRV